MVVVSPPREREPGRNTGLYPGNFSFSPAGKSGQGYIAYRYAVRHFLKITEPAVLIGIYLFPDSRNIREHTNVRDNSLAVGQELPKLLARVRFPVIA